MSFYDGLIGGFIGAIIGGFSNFFAQRYFFIKFGHGLDIFENKILNLIKNPIYKNQITNKA